MTLVVVSVTHGAGVTRVELRYVYEGQRAHGVDGAELFPISRGLRSYWLRVVEHTGLKSDLVQIAHGDGPGPIRPWIRAMLHIRWSRSRIWMDVRAERVI